MPHSSVRLYHQSVSGSTYALLVIFARRSSVSRFETSGPMMSSCSQSSVVLCPRIESARASEKAAADGGCAVRTGAIGMDRGWESGWRGECRGTSAKYTCAEGVTA
jgi:hypothetical protein